MLFHQRISGRACGCILATLAKVAITLVPCSANADTLHWNNPAGGMAHIASNWNPVQAPAANDSLFFPLAGSYTVTYTASMPNAISHLYYLGANVTAECDATHTANAITIYSNSSLTLAAGTMSALAGIELRDTAIAPATLNLQSSSTLIGPSALFGLIVGSNGEGVLNITAGADLLMDSSAASTIYIGNDSGEVGTVTVSGTGVITTNRSSIIGQPNTDIRMADLGGTATLHILAGGLVNCENLYTGSVANGDAEIFVSGAAGPFFPTRSTLAVENEFELGYGGGDGLLEIGEHGLVTVNGELTVGSEFVLGGSGLLIILPGATLIASDLTVNAAGGSLAHFGGEIVIDGGNIETDDAGLILSGLDPDSPPTITFENGGGSYPADGDILLGAIANARGTINARHFGSRIALPENGQLIIGDAEGSFGTVNLEDDARIDSFETSTTIIAGKSGSGTLNVNTGAEIHANNIRLGAQPAGEGTITVEGISSSILANNNIHVAGSNAGPGGAGTLNVVDGASVDVLNDLVIWSGGAVSVASAFIEVANNLDLRGALELANLADPLDLADVYVDATMTIFSSGTLSGAGRVHGGIANHGVISPTGAGLEFGGIVTGAGVSFSGAPIRFIDGGGFVGEGAIDCRVSGEPGTTITATNALVLGRLASTEGFNFDGDLFVGPHSVTLFDANRADSGRTELQGGTLVVSNGFDVDATPTADELRGYGIVLGDLRNSGGTISPGIPSADRTGFFSVNGELAMTDAAALTIVEIEGPAPANATASSPAARSRWLAPSAYPPSTASCRPTDPCSRSSAGHR